MTYTKDVAPILQNRCQACHRAGQTAPFSLTSYDDAVKHAAMIKEVTTQRRMPPWHADPRYGHFANDRRLTPRGNRHAGRLGRRRHGPRRRQGPAASPVEWPKGWSHGKPDLVLTMPEEFEVPADGVLPYKNWIIDTKFNEDKLGDDRRGPTRYAGRGASRRRLHPARRAAGPDRAGRQHLDPGRLGAGRPGPGLPAGHGPARPQGGQAAPRDALHAQRQGGEGSLVDRA